MYEKGRGVTQDDKQAVEWYSKAAERGLPMAKESLLRLKK
jgi:TPR repeat protein